MEPRTDPVIADWPFFLKLWTYTEYCLSCFYHYVLLCSHFPHTSHLSLQTSNAAILRQLKYFYPTLGGGHASDGCLWCAALLVPRPRGVSHRWETINMNLWRQASIAARQLSIYICSPSLSKPENIISTNNSQETEIIESYNCVWNCNYCYHSLLSQAFSVSRCANWKNCHCLSGLDQPYSELPAPSTCNYGFLLTNHSWCEK